MFETLGRYWGAIHGMNELFSTYQDQDARWGVLLVDTANAFIFLNHAAMLLHTCVLVLDVLMCPLTWNDWCWCLEAHSHFFRVKRELHRVILCPCSCMQLVLYLWSIHFVILEDGHSCAMLMVLKLLLVELCQNFMIGLIYFPHVIPGLAIIA